MAEEMPPGVGFLDVEAIREKLRRIISSIDKILSERERVRDEMIKKSRDVIRLSGWIVNSLQRGDLDSARRYLEEMEKVVREFMDYARRDEALYYTGMVANTLAEYVEAKVFYSLVVEAKLPDPDELEVTEVPYLQGLGDVIGELRRLALDMLRLGRITYAEKLLELMEAIYYEMRGLEYPEALLPGVKHKIDVARRLIDDTKALLLEVKGRTELLEALGRG
ncbi:MAG: haloacid dehalogenase [Pyrodictiaceae archaeon]